MTTNYIKPIELKSSVDILAMQYNKLRKESVRKFLNTYGYDFRAIDVDQGDWYVVANKKVYILSNTSFGLIKDICGFNETIDEEA